MAHHKSVRDFSFTYYKNLSKTFANFSSFHSFYGKLKNNPDHIVNVKGDKILFTFDTANFVYEKYFIDSIKNRLLYDRSYYVLIKIRHDDDLYKMAGKQFIFIHTKDVEQFLSDLYSLIVKRVGILMERYHIGKIT